MHKGKIAGGLLVTAAFLIWGANPIYFKAISHVDPAEVITHRVIWSALLLIAVVSLARTWPVVSGALRDPRAVMMLSLSASLLAANWLLLLWAVNLGRVLESGLGYFINPLLNILLGVLVLRERLSPWAALAVGLAAAGVLYLAVQADTIPWIGLALAVTFSLYGLVRKTVGVSAVEGHAVEILLMLPVALAFLIYLVSHGQSAFWFADLRTNGLLFCAGAVSLTPLVCFADGVRRLDYSTVGFFQYIQPTGHFLLAVFVFGEAFTVPHMIAFSLIWLALAIFTGDTVRQERRQRREANDRTNDGVD